MIVTPGNRETHLASLISTHPGSSARYAVGGFRRFSAQLDLVVDTPVADDIVSVDTSADTITFAPGFGDATGLLGQFSTTGTLPDPLAPATNYYLIIPDPAVPTVVQVATSLANALAGTAIVLTDAGTGTHTFTPTALAGGLLTYQWSNYDAARQLPYIYDATHWVNLAAGKVFTASTTSDMLDCDPAFATLGINVGVTAGRVTTAIRSMHERLRQ